VGHLQRLIVFDLDGTLIDSRRDLADSANALIVERGGRPLPVDVIAGMVGDGAAMLVRRALDAAHLTFDDRSVPRYLELYDERLLRTTTAYEGIPEAVAALAREWPVVVLTNKPIGPTRRLLEALNLAPLVLDAMGSDGPFPRKPDPASLRHLISTFGSDAAHTVLVGDSHVDVATARAAGAHVCLARYGFGYRPSPDAMLVEGDVSIDHPAELPSALSRLFGV
jgi:phosphoglycolate phosphatase